jgi:non-homologous end joining protein Ku
MHVDFRSTERTTWLKPSSFGLLVSTLVGFISDTVRRSQNYFRDNDDYKVRFLFALSYYFSDFLPAYLDSCS